MKFLNRLSSIAALLFTVTGTAYAQEIPMSQKMAATVMKVWPVDTASASGKPFKKWNYDEGVILKGIEAAIPKLINHSIFDW